MAGTFTASSSATFSGGVSVTSGITAAAVTATSNITSSGVVTANAGFKDATQTIATSSAQLIPAYGVTVMNSTLAAAYTIDNPIAGIRKVLQKIDASTQIISVTVTSTAATFNGTNTVLTFDGLNQRAELQGLSSTRWLLLTSTASLGNIS